MTCAGCGKEIKSAMICDETEGFHCGECWPKVGCEANHPDYCATAVFED